MTESSLDSRSTAMGATASCRDPSASQEQSLSSMLPDEEGDSLEGDRLVYWFKKGRGRVPAFSAKLALAGFSGTSAPRELPEIPLSPAVVASAIRGASKRGKRCKSSEGAATASSGTAGKPFTAQQHAVVAALMVVMKRAMREGHEAVLTAMTRLLCNNLYTVVVLELMGEDQELPSMKAIEQALLGEGQDLVDLLARQCAAADFQPLEVFTRSAQCGAMTACKLAHSIAVANSPQRAAALTRHYLVAELEEHFEKHSLPPTWGNTTSNLLMRQGIPRGMAELVIYLVPLLEGLCKRCFYPADPWQGGAREYAAMDHLLPGILNATLHIPRRDLMCARGLAQLVGPTEKVLQWYKTRAVACGQTFGHVIRLEAAVLGWPEDGPEYTKTVLEGMIKAEPALARSAGADSASLELAENESAEDAENGLKAAAAYDSPERPPIQAASAETADDNWTEVAQAGSKPEKSGLHVATVSASNLPGAGRKERQRKAAARKSSISAAGSSGGPADQQSPGSAHRSSPASPELPAPQQKPSSTAQAGAPAGDALLQDAGRLLPEFAEALPTLASNESRRKGKGKLNRSEALPTGGVHAAPGMQAALLGVPGDKSPAAAPGSHTSAAGAAAEHTSALSSPAEHPKSSPSAFCGSSSAQRLKYPIYEAMSAAHQHRNGGSSMPGSGQHAVQCAQPLSLTPVTPEKEPWHEVRSGRRKPAAKPSTAKAGKACNGSQTLPKTQPKSTAAAQMPPQRAQRLRDPPGFAPPGFTAGPKLPKHGPTQADIGAAHQRPALHASVQRQPAQASTAMHDWPPLPGSARPETEHTPRVLKVTAVGAPQQQMDHEALLEDLLLELRASSTTSKQHTVTARTDAREPQNCGQEEDDHICVVCIDNYRVAMFLDCGHLCACESCADDIMSRAPPLCPMCRGSIERTLRVRF